VIVLPHPDPLYRVEGDPMRRADGIYDAMSQVGADEVVIETLEHAKQLEDLRDDQIQMVLEAWRQRIEDLKRDLRFKYVSVFKDFGVLAGRGSEHAYSQVTATTFVPRRILYELRAAREWYKEKERCVFCDIVKQEERQAKRIVDTQGDYVALCPYASRVPFEVWILDRKHNHQFEQPRPGSNRRNLGALLRRVLRRLRQVAPAYHLVVHSSPNTIHPKGETTTSYWKTIKDDYHWHIEILPIVKTRSKSYNIKEVYFNELTPEQAAEKLRRLDPQS
jgi:UDPglucose--hexose-1-phosphate uridylyltransferase